MTLLNFKFTTLTLFLLLSNFSYGQKAWSNDHYEKYNYRSFSKYGPANEKMNPKKIDIALLNAALFYATNRVRDKKNLPTLKHHSALEKSAQGHAKDMAKLNFFSHTSKVKKKRTLEDRLELVGMINVGYAENIAYNVGYPVSGKPFYPPSVNGGYFSFEVKGKPIEPFTYIEFAETIMKQWMNSPPHRANIMDINQSFLGTGTAVQEVNSEDEMSKIFAVQNFADREKGD